MATMLKGNTVTGREWVSTLGLVAVAGYAFLYQQVHNAAGKNIFAALLCLALFLWAVRQPALFRGILAKPGWTVGATIALLAVAGVSSALGYTPSESWVITGKQLGIETLVCVLTAALVSDERLGESRLRILALAIAAGLALRVGLVLLDNSPHLLPGPYTRGYATMAGMIIPVVLATLLAWRWPTAVKYGLIALLLVAFWLILDYPNKTRAAVYCLVAGIFTMLVLSRRWKLLFTLAILLIAGLLALSLLRPGSVARYGSVFKKATYQEEGVSGRIPIWLGTYDLVKERPWLGYGPGWKKLPTVAREGGYIDRWVASGDKTQRESAEYFSMSVGKVNPHNLYMQVLFEVGAFGLATLLSLALALFFAGWRALQRQTIDSGGAATWFGLASLGFVASWLVGGVANGFWSDVTPLFVLAGAAKAMTYRPGASHD